MPRLWARSRLLRKRWDWMGLREQGGAGVEVRGGGRSQPAVCITLVCLSLAGKGP